MRKNEYEKTEEERYGLTSKQLSFCKEYLKTNDVVNSYKAVYNTNASPNSISGQAYRVYNNVKVQAYIKDMKRIAYDKAIKENKDIMNTQDVLEWLSNVVRSESRSIKMNDRLKACDMLLKAGGAYIQKIEADVKSINDIVINITNNEEDDEQ